VDGNDLSIVLGHWGASGSAADFNRDGSVDFEDLLLLLAGWG
jgi:hypothetical protein